MIVYCNPACAAWVGVPAEELIGQTCVYGAPAEGVAVTRAAIAAARLCPPPGALAEGVGRGCVSAIDDRGELVFRQAEFLPLSPVAASTELSVEGPALSDDPFVDIAAGARRREYWCWSTPRIGPSRPRSRTTRTSRRPTRCTPSWLAGGTGWPVVIAWSGWSAPARRPPACAQVSLAAAAPANVLIVGPPGSGKEHVAKAIHYRRPSELTGSLVPVDCAVLDAELLVSTLKALSRSAPQHSDHWRTLLLSHVDALSLETQAALMPLVGSLGSWRLIGTAVRRPAELVAEGLAR